MNVVTQYLYVFGLEGPTPTIEDGLLKSVMGWTIILRATRCLVMSRRTLKINYVQPFSHEL
jgi:hypothetical protein